MPHILACLVFLQNQSRKVYNDYYKESKKYILLMMKKLTFVIFFFFGFLFFASFSFAQEEAGTAPTLPQPTQFQPDSEKEMMQKAVERLMPNALSGQSACTFWDQVKGKIFGDFACDSQNYQNIMMPSQTTAAGEVVGKVEGATDSAVLGIKEEGEVKGISIPLIGDLIGFINSILGGKQSGGAFYIYRADESLTGSVPLGLLSDRWVIENISLRPLPVYTSLKRVMDVIIARLNI